LYIQIALYIIIFLVFIALYILIVPCFFLTDYKVNYIIKTWIFFPCKKCKSFWERKKNV